MDTLNLWIKYRPLRIGWCVSDDDFNALRKAFHLTHTMWGGRYNPIIPIGDTALSEQLINLFNVDILFPVSTGKPVDNFIKKYSYLPYPFFSFELFYKNKERGGDATILDLYHPIRHLYEEHHKNNLDPTLKTFLFDWDDDDSLADVFLATFGKLPSHEEIGIDYDNLIIEHLKGETIDLSGKKKLPPDSFEKLTVNRICTLKLQYSRAHTSYWNSSGFYVGNPSDFYDLVTYWNLRATNTNLYFYDPNLPDRLDEFRNEYLTHLRKQLDPTNRFDNHITVWSKSREDEIDLNSFGKGLMRCSPGSGTWNGLNVKAPLMHFGEKSILSSVGKERGKTNVSFSLPEKPFFNVRETHNQHLVVSIKPIIDIRESDQETLNTPYLPELNEYYGRNFYFDWNKARVESEGIGIIIDLWHENLGISALNVNSLVSKIFEVSGMLIQPSKAGLVSYRLIQQLGGLQGCRVLKIEGVRALIEKYRSDQSFTRSAATQMIGQNDPNTGIPNFSDYEDLFIESRPWKKKLKPENAFTYLLQQKVFRVGLKLLCSNCNLDFWHPLDNVRTETTCDYCGKLFDITSQLKDRDWHFRRSGLFGKDNNQEGGIPVALTLQQLDANIGDHDNLFTTAMEIQIKNVSAKKCEIDFIILSQKNFYSNINIAIGECKTRKEITEQDVLNLKLVAEKLEGKGIKTFVVFAKLTDFTSEELERCKTVNDKYHRRLILLTSRELEPYHIYEKTAKEFIIDRHAVSFEDMVNNTQAVFYEKKKVHKEDVKE